MTADIVGLAGTKLTSVFGQFFSDKGNISIVLFLFIQETNDHFRFDI